MSVAEQLEISLSVPIADAIKPDVDRLLEATRQELGDKRFAQCSQEGAVLSMEDATSLAMEIGNLSTA